MSGPGQGELTVDLGAIAENYRRIAAHVGKATVAAVVKANAYGLGMAEVAPVLWAAGARHFYVATIDEALSLRALLPKAYIFLLNGIFHYPKFEYEHYALIPVLNSIDEIEIWRSRAAARGRALPAHIQIDTGMNRLGLPAAELQWLQAEPARLNGLRVDAWLSHLAVADEPGHPLTFLQRDRFRAALATLPPAPASLANSAGIWHDPSLHFDAVRPGAALYGLRPLPDAPNPMRQVVRLTAQVLQIRSVDRGETVGYGASYTLPKTTKIATVSAGYADGFIRFSGQSPDLVRHVRIGNSLAPVIGRVSMDLITVDVGDVPGPIEPGTMVELIGADHDADDAAREAGTIGYEILTALGQRYRRTYIPAEPAELPAAHTQTVPQAIQ